MNHLPHAGSAAVLAVANFGKVEAPLANAKGEGIAKVFLNLQTGLPLLLDFGLKLAAFLLLVLLAVGGLRYMAAIGNEEGSETAKRLMSSAVVGFALLLGTWAIMRFAFTLLGYRFGT